MQVGLRTNDGLNIHIADDGLYHFTFYERGKLGFDRAGSLDDLLYGYCEGVVTSQAAQLVGDRAERFKYEYKGTQSIQYSVGEKAGARARYSFPWWTARGYFPPARHWRTAMTNARAPS
jgi:hypothetical protein